MIIKWWVVKTKEIFEYEEKGKINKINMSMKFKYIFPNIGHYKKEEIFTLLKRLFF